MISRIILIISFVHLSSAAVCDQQDWTPMTIINGGDSPWCFQANEYPDYDAKNGKNGPCAANSVCKVYDGVESPEKCHDIVKGSELCDDKWGFQYNSNGGRCWAKGDDGEAVGTTSTNYVTGPIDRAFDCEQSGSGDEDNGGVESGSGDEDNGGVDPIKQSVVKRLLRIVPEMVRRTKGNVRRVVNRMKNDIDEIGSNYDPEQSDLISRIDQELDDDDPTAFGRLMERIDRLNAYYRANGEPRGSQNIDYLDQGQVRVLLRVAGAKHQIGYKADLNRQMNKIITIRDDEGLNYGLTYSEDDLEEATTRNTPAYQWLPLANMQYHELNEKYRRDGSMK